MSNKDEQAFPQQQMMPKPGLSGTGDPFYLATLGGLTKREYAAIQIMAGLVANGNIKKDLLYAPMAVCMADELLDELEKEPT